MTPEPSFEFLHGLGRYEEKRRQLQAERRKDYQTHLEQTANSGSAQHLSRHSQQRQLLHHQTYPKSFACTARQQKPQERNEASGDQVTRSMSEKRLKHEKYRQELQKQIEEKELLNEQQNRRLQDEDQRMEIRVQKDRGNLRREYETEMANIRLKSRSQPDLRQAVPEPAPRKVRSPSYVFVNKRPAAARPRIAVPTRLRFGDKMPQSASTATQTGDSLMEEVAIQTPKPEPHPRVSKLSKSSQMRIVQIKQKLKENQEKMLLNLASAKHNRKT